MLRGRRKAVKACILESKGMLLGAGSGERKKVWWGSWGSVVVGQ